MKAFRISGLDKTTGAPVTKVLRAESEDDAVRDAGKSGVAVSNVKCLGAVVDPHPPPSEVQHGDAHETPSGYGARSRSPRRVSAGGLAVLSVGLLWLVVILVQGPIGVGRAFVAVGDSEHDVEELREGMNSATLAMYEGTATLREKEYRSALTSPSSTAGQIEAARLQMEAAKKKVADLKAKEAARAQEFRRKDENVGRSVELFGAFGATAIGVLVLVSRFQR